MFTYVILSTKSHAAEGASGKVRKATTRSVIIYYFIIVAKDFALLQKCKPSNMCIGGLLIIGLR